MRLILLLVILVNTNLASATEISQNVIKLNTYSVTEPWKDDPYNFTQSQIKPPQFEIETQTFAQKMI